MATTNFHDIFLYNTISQIIPTIPYMFLLLLLLKFFKIRKYDIDDQIVVKRIQKRIGGICMEYINNEPTGIIFGKWYYAYITREKGYSTPRYNIILICSEQTYNLLTLAHNETINKEDDINNDNIIINIKTPTFSTLKVFSRTCEFTNQQYSKHIYKVKHYEPTFQQNTIINNIIDNYNISHNLVVLLYGPPNTGKSMIAQLLTTNLSAYYCNNFNPTLPNTTLSYLYSLVEPTKETPLIVLMNEVDIMIDNIHNNKIDQHKFYEKKVLDKSSWNNFLDDFHTLFQHTILIMTSNKSPNYINSLDPSYIRKGRVDMIEYMDKVIQ